MTKMTDRQEPGQAAQEDQVSAIHRVLRDSPEPLTVAKLRAALPMQHRAEAAELTEVLQRQVSANVLVQYPRYRSQQERYWDRPLAVHVGELIRAALGASSLNFAELRRKLPAYARERSEVVLGDMVARGELYRHPRLGRGGERYGLQPADARDYVRPELTALFRRLEPLGFTLAQLRAGAMELLHDEEWS